MSAGELLVILIVTLVVFGPKKLPMLAQHLGLLVRKINDVKHQAALFWQQLIAEQQLRDNEEKAKQADASYRRDKERVYKLE